MVLLWLSLEDLTATTSRELFNLQFRFYLIFFRGEKFFLLAIDHHSFVFAHRQ